MQDKMTKTEKKCHKCKNVKPLDMFYKSKNRGDGHNSACKECAQYISREWKLKNRERSIENCRKWRLEHPDREAASSRKTKLKHKYGLSIDDYNKMLKEQGCCCKICGITVDVFGKNLVVDHDHKTGKIRGLLCNSCNSVLGYAKEDEKIMLNAIEYLKQHKEVV